MSVYTRYNAPLDIRYDKNASEILGGDHWRVTRGFRYLVNAKGTEWVDIPLGYLTDGASVPRPFWGNIPPWGIYGQAAVVHDYLCEYLTVQTQGSPKAITRKEGDDIFLEAMLILGVPTETARVIHLAVASFRVVARISKPSLDPVKLTLEETFRKAVQNQTPACPIAPRTDETNLKELEDELEEKPSFSDIEKGLTQEWIIRDKTAVEAGYVNNKDDLGGETNHGITVAVAKAREKLLKEKFGWNGQMKDLSKEMAYFLYELDYWKPLYLDEVMKLSPFVADKLFDIGINAGTGRAATWLQTYLNVMNRKGELYEDLKVDGVLGPKTMAQLRAYVEKRGKRALPRLLLALISNQGYHYVNISNAREANETFTYGWFGRLEHNLDVYLHYLVK